MTFGKVLAFWDEPPGADGWARVVRMHHQPDVVDAGLRAQGALINFTRPPAAKDGWRAVLFVQPITPDDGSPMTGVSEWRIERDTDYRMPAPEFLALIPATARVQARALVATDPVIADFMALIDMMALDSASRGIHPGGKAAKDGLGYLVHLGLMTAAEAAEITEP